MTLPTALHRMRFALCSGILAFVLGTFPSPMLAAPIKPIASKVLVIGHRGASALRPEHTLASYAVAIQDGADFVEPDLVATKDGVLVVRHENEIGGTTDVASHPEFAARRTTKTIDGVTVSGWFTEDFTLAELKTLRARERLGDVRKASAGYDGQFAVPTFEEMIEFVAAEASARGRLVGIIPKSSTPRISARSACRWKTRCWRRSPRMPIRARLRWRSSPSRSAT